MTIDVARLINRAACQVWFFKHEIIPCLPRETANLVRRTSIAQIQTAAEMIEAENAAVRPVNGVLRLEGMIDNSALEELKAYVDTLPE